MPSSGSHSSGFTLGQLSDKTVDKVMGDQAFRRSMDQQGSTQGWASGHQVLLLTSAQHHHIDHLNISGFFMEVFLKEPRSKQEETIPILDFRSDGKKCYS